MDSVHQVLASMAELDRMRASGENLKANGDAIAPLVLKVCDVGDEVCRYYVELYRYIDENPQEFGSPAVRRRYEAEILPLEEKRDSLSRLLKEQCAGRLGL